MKKPKIWNDITNIFAKLASSADYDPRVKYDTSLEFYANQVPVLPKPKAGDDKKAVVVKSDGTYELKSVETTSADIVALTAQMTAQQAANTRQNIGAEPEKFVITVIYDDVSDEYTADVAFEEIEAAYEAGKTIQCYYAPDIIMTYLDFLQNNDSANFVGFVSNDFDDNGSLITHILSINISEDDTCSVTWTYYISAPAVVTDIDSTSITLAAKVNTEYHYGELASLTISSFPASGEFSIVFTSGSTETVLTVPQTLIMPDGFAVEASTRYEINVKNGYAVVGSWSVSA